MPPTPEHLATVQDILTALIDALQKLAASPPKVPSEIHHVVCLDPSLLWLAVPVSFLAATMLFFSLVLVWRKK
jgi:hypothetical protein